MPLQSQLKPAASGFTRTTEVPLYWVAYGDAVDDRVLVLHGGPGAHHDYLLPQMAALAGRHQLVFYDQRGGGQSADESRAAVTWQTHVADLAAVIAELNLNPVTIIGYSWGGLLALLYATRPDPDNGDDPARSSADIARLVLIDPAPAQSNFRRTMEAEFGRRQRSEYVERERKKLQESGMRESSPPDYRQRLFELSVTGYFFDPKTARDLTPFRVVGRIQDSVWKSLGVYDLLPEIKALSIPALVVHGRDDPIPIESSLAVAEALEARLLLLEKCGHVPYVERPHALFSAIESFLDDYHANNPE